MCTVTRLLFMTLHLLELWQIMQLNACPCLCTSCDPKSQIPSLGVAPWAMKLPKNSTFHSIYTQSGNHFLFVGSKEFAQPPVHTKQASKNPILVWKGNTPAPIDCLHICNPELDRKFGCGSTCTQDNDLIRLCQFQVIRNDGENILEWCKFEGNWKH